MSVYLDVSVLVALFTRDALSDQADRALSSIDDSVMVSEFASTEFSSAISIRVRTRDLTADEAFDTFRKFDSWVTSYAERAEIVREDVANATALVRQLALSLRAPDALHVAMVQRTGAKLLTFDRTMAAAARRLGIELSRY